MRNKTTTYKWAYLPFVFSSTVILATTQATAVPAGNQRYQDATQVNRISHEYVGGQTQLGVGVTDDGDIDIEANQVISESENHSTGVGLWAGYDLKGDDKGILGRGAQINHNWVSRDASGRAKHVNKVFAAYDRNQAGHDKATVGYGQENKDLFWEGHVSKGLSGRKGARTDAAAGQQISDRAYDYGVGGTVGKFLPDSNVRVRAGLDHEWSNKVGTGEKNARNTTLSAGLEKFFQGSGHSVSLDVAASKQSGGYRDGGADDTDVRGRLGYRYDFGGASIYQPDRRYRRVRVEVPGKTVPPRYAQKAQFKRVPTYKTVPVYGNKTIRTPYKQLVKSTMELEGQTFFKLNSSKLIPSAQTRLKQIAAQIRKTGYKGSIRITGNTCGLGDAVYDQRLSERRANAVKKFLVKNGFNRDHLIARGLGKGHPKYPRTAGQDFKNRRVDIEYVSQQQAYKTAYKTEQKSVQTGTRKVATGFKNVPTGSKNVLIDNGRAGSPRVIWRTEVIPTSPAWIKRALHNNIKHDRNVNTFTTTEGFDSVNGNTNPNAVNDSQTTGFNQATTINVLANDTDPQRGPLTVTSFTQGTNGTVTRGANGQLVYTPQAGFTGKDTFTYTISDGNGGTDTATVSVTVNGNTKPNAVNDLQTTGLNQAVTLNVLANDTDPENDRLSVTGFTQGTNGTVTRGANGQLVYTPQAGFTGKDTFTYTISDGNGGTDTATVSVTVNGNTKPNAVNDLQTTGLNQAVTINVLVNDTDPENDRLSVTGFTQGTNGTVTDANGQLVYTPRAGFTGKDTFTYTISDGNGGTDTATVSVTVNSSGNTKPNAVNDLQTTGLNQAVTINVLVNDTDPENDRLSVTGFTQGTNGTVTDANGQLVYTPRAGFTGKDTFIYTISDGNGGTDTATVSVTVNSSGNTIPAAVNDLQTTGLNQAVTINVLANDTDPENDRLSVTGFTQGTNGTVTTGANGQLVYTPRAGFIGKDTFTYTISDNNGGTDTARVSIVVNNGSTKPNAVDDFQAILLNTGNGINVLANDTDPQRGPLTVTSFTQGTNGTVTTGGKKGHLIYTPQAGFTGTDVFTYTISDSNGGTDTATVTVTAQDGGGNIIPNAVNDSQTTGLNQRVTLNVLANDMNARRITSFTQGTRGGTVTGGGKRANGQLVYTPRAGFTGTDTFTYTISGPKKPGATDTATVSVIVNSGNTKPDAVSDYRVINRFLPASLNVLANDTDPENDSLRIISFTQGTRGGRVTRSANSGELIYTPSPSFSTGRRKKGTGDTFTYTISDGNGGTDTATVSLD